MSVEVVVKNTNLSKRANQRKKKKKKKNNKTPNAAPGTKLAKSLMSPDLRFIESAIKLIPEDRKSTLVKILMRNISNGRKPSLKQEVKEFVEQEEAQHQLPLDDAVFAEQYKRMQKHNQEKSKKKDEREKALREQKQLELKNEKDRKRRIRYMYDPLEDPDNSIIHTRYLDDTNRQQTKVRLSVHKWLSEKFFSPSEWSAKVSLLPDDLKASIKSPYHFKKFASCGVYRFYNDEGMSYVGESQDVWSRISNHLSPSVLESSRGKLQQYVREHGCETLKVEILVYGSMLGKSSYVKFRKHLEAFLIHEYNSIENGWNVKVEHTLEEDGFDIETTRKLCESWGILPEKG